MAGGEGGVREETGKLLWVQLQVSEAGQDIFLSISVSSTCQHLNGGKCHCFLCINRYFFYYISLTEQAS